MDTIWFHEALDRAGASQADLSRHLGLAPSAVSRMLKGERQMKLLEAVQVANFLGVTQDEVLRRAGEAGRRVEYLAFVLAGETYAVQIAHVAEILPGRGNAGNNGGRIRPAESQSLGQAGSIRPARE